MDVEPDGLPADEEHALAWAYGVLGLPVRLRSEIADRCGCEPEVVDRAVAELFIPR